MFNLRKKPAIALGLMLIFMADAGADHRNDSQRHSYTKPRQAPSAGPKTRRYSTKPEYLPAPHYVDDYRPGRHINPLPYGASRLWHDQNEYYYYEGYFYRPVQNGYFLINAPIGAVVVSLPRLHHRVMRHGVPYYVVGNTYYTRHPRGYVVVDSLGGYRR